MRLKTILLCISGILAASTSYGQSAFTEEEFTEDDFAQFFSLIEGGKISKEKMSERCEDQSIGFTFAGKDIRHDRSPLIASLTIAACEQLPCLVRTVRYQ